MQNELLREIRLKISAGTATEEELAIWEAWINQPFISSKQFVTEEEIEQRLRIDLAKPGWESFLEQQKHNLIHHEELMMAQPNHSDALFRETIPGRPARKLLIALSAAIIIGLVLSTAAYLLLGTHEKGSQQLSKLDFEIIQTRSGETKAYTLPDSTKVWLNTNTRLRYPRLFGHTSRTVELNGEAYFEVTKDEKLPFIVLTDSSETRVLGTHFNVDAYEGAGVQRISLLEGAVLVAKKSEGSVKKLEPGEQSILSADSFTVISMPRPDDVTAWKRDSFAFDQVPLTVIMQKLAQYYNISVKIEKGVENKKYTIGSTARTVPVIEILNGMERTNGMRFFPKKKSIEPGETITILRNE